MESSEVMVIQSRLGIREVRLDKVIHFPRGIIGFENMHEFTLLQIQENAPLLVLQSIQEPSLGLLVADPFAFLPDYNLTISDAEQQILCVTDAREVAVLVTASIPPGKPEETALTLLGPIVVNYHARIGLQIPQMDRGDLPPKVFVKMREFSG